MTTEPTRLEHDLLGEKAVPADAYYGVQTARALENFAISGIELRLYPDFIKALAMVKLAAARANFDCGQFSAEILAGIEGACLELIDGKLHDQFRLDVFQGGAGTSTNMNANEVIANRALELMGYRQGRLQPLQPARSRQRLAVDQRRLPDRPACRAGAGQRAPHRGDAGADRVVPGKEPRLWRRREDGADAAPGRGADDARPGVRRVRRDAGRRVRALEALQRVLCEINMGATAIGTGLNAPAGYAQKCTDHLARITGFPIQLAPDLIEATQDTQAFVLYSSCMKSLAIKLSKVCNDLRLLVVGPALRPARDQPAGQAARLLDHAGQGQPGHSGSGQHGLLPRDRDRPHRDDGGRGRSTAAQRVRAGHRRVPLRGADDVHQRGATRSGCTASTASPPTRTSAATTSTTASAPSRRSTPSSATTARRNWPPRRWRRVAGSSSWSARNNSSPRPRSPGCSIRRR